MNLKLRLSKDSYYDKYLGFGFETIVIETETKIFGIKERNGELVWVSVKTKYETFRRRLDVNFES